MKIWKYEIHADTECIEMPQGAKVLTVQIDQKTGEPCIWAEVSPEKPMEKRSIHIVGTGHEFPNKEYGRYVGTFQWGPLVFHVYEG